MPRISLALSEIIKRRLFRAREHLQCCSVDTLDDRVAHFSYAVFEIARGLNLPAVRSVGVTPPRCHIEDVTRNLTTIIDADLTRIETKEDPEMLVCAAQELMAGIHLLPLPAEPPARTA